MLLKKALFAALAAGASAGRTTLSKAADGTALPADEELVTGAGDLPEYFDSRSAWFGCGLTVLDQVRWLQRGDADVLALLLPRDSGATAAGQDAPC